MKDKAAENLLSILNYVDRETISGKNDTIKDVKQQALAKLYSLISSSPLPANTQGFFEEEIITKKRDIAREKNQEIKREYESQLVILKDCIKIINMSSDTINIHSNYDKAYFTLPESVGGVTQKISLISCQSAMHKLNKIINTSGLTITSYLQERESHQIRPEAILKLPKHNKVTEVQREAIALHISRILDFETTEFTMVSHHNKPALFIPFDTIRLMSEFASGKTYHAYLGKPKDWGKSYQHYSTIKPIGEGLQPDQAIEDFGNKLAYFYLCNDPDAFGGYNQNKALKNNKNLYIFDQVVMSKDFLGLDSRLSLFQNSSIRRHIRHWQGRNRMLVEDSSFDQKFESIFKLIQASAPIISSLDNLIQSYDNKIRSLPNKADKQQKAEIKAVIELRGDAMTTKDVILRRIDALFNNLPKINGQKIPHNLSEENKTILKDVLILEKVLNNPTLFSEDGRPYKYPSTYRNNLIIKNIKFVNDDVVLEFNHRPNREILNVIRKKTGINIKTGFFNRPVTINKNVLKNITENLLMPESSNKFDRQHNYLNTGELNILKQAYKPDNRSNAIKVIQLYDRDFKRLNGIENKLRVISRAFALINDLLSKSTNKGFLMHVKKRLELDIQQKLQAMLQVDDSRLLTDAVETAIKLDRLDIFNVLLSKVLHLNYHNNNNNKQFEEDLKRLTVFGKEAGDYASAGVASKKFKDEAERLIQTLTVDNTLQRLNLEGIGSESDNVQARQVIKEPVPSPQSPPHTVPREEGTIQAMRHSLQKFCSKKSGSFFSMPYQSLANFLSQKITSDMSIVEIVHLVTVIESIKLEDFRLETRLESEQRLVISDYIHNKPIGLPGKIVNHLFVQGHEVIDRLQPIALSEKKHRDFLGSMIQLHSTLLTMMERHLIKANIKGNSEYQLNYPIDELESSQPLTRIEVESRQVQPAGTSNSPIDSQDKTMTLGDKMISVKDPAIRNEIESFTKDKISDLGSQANKIFYFGGQFLYAKLAGEFGFATEFNGMKAIPHISNGSMSWQRTPDGHIVAEIVLDVFSIQVNEQFYLLNTVGNQLEQIDVNQERGKNILQNLPKETSGSTRLRAPIGSIKAIVELVKDRGDTHVLRTREASIQYHTDSLTCIRQPQQENGYNCL